MACDPVKPVTRAPVSVRMPSQTRAARSAAPPDCVPAIEILTPRLEPLAARPDGAEPPVPPLFDKMPEPGFVAAVVVAVASVKARSGALGRALPGAWDADIG